MTHTLWPGGARIHGQRFTPKGLFDCLYISSDQQTALAETRHILVIPGGPPVALGAGPSVVLTIETLIVDTLDLTDEATQEQLGTSISELTGEWRVTQKRRPLPPTQLLGKLAYETENIHALLYTSAKNPENGSNLVIFTDRFGCGKDCYVEVYDPSRRLNQRFE